MSQKTKKSRREFLKGAAATGGAVAIVAATGQNVMAEEAETLAVPKKSKGYQETQHIRDYYNSTRS